MTLYCSACHEPLEVTQRDEDAWETHPCDCYARPLEELIDDAEDAATEMQKVIDTRAESKGAISYRFVNVLNKLSKTINQARKAL